MVCYWPDLRLLYLNSPSEAARMLRKKLKYGNTHMQLRAIFVSPNSMPAGSNDPVDQSTAYRRSFHLSLVLLHWPNPPSLDYKMSC